VCCPQLWGRAPSNWGTPDRHNFLHQDARAERRVREASRILVCASQVESTQIHASARRAYYVPTPTWWSAMKVPFGFPARMPHIVAYFGTALCRGDSTPAAAILATEWVLEVAGVWYASARIKAYLWHLPASLVDRLVGLHLANMAEGADPDSHAYLSELLDLQQSLDWAATGPYLARPVGGEDDEAARAFVHCDRRLVGGRVGFREGQGDPDYPYAAGVTATSPPPESGWGSAGVASPHQRKRTRGAAERPPDRWGVVRRTTWAGSSPVGRSARLTFVPPRVPYYPALGVGQRLSWGNVTPRCAHDLASTYLRAARMLRAAHGEAIVASLVDTLAWVTWGAGAVLRGSSSSLSAVAKQFLLDTTPKAIGYQMASRLEGHGQREAPGPVVPAAAGSSIRASYAGEPAAAAAPYHGGGFYSSAGGASAAGHSSYVGGYSAVGAAPSGAPRSTWGAALDVGLGPADQESAHEYPVDLAGHDHYGGFTRDDLPPPPGWD